MFVGFASSLAADPLSVRPQPQMKPGHRVFLATVVGVLSTLALWVLAGREYEESWWLCALAGSGLAAVAVAILLSVRGGAIRTFVSAVAAVIVLICSSLPVYWWAYRGEPAGTHVSIPVVLQHAGQLAWLISGLTMGVLRLIFGAAAGRAPASRIAA